jgi:predicted nucleotidyltransferase
VRNEAHVEAIRAVLAAFGEHAQHLVFVGGCALGLYARRDGAPLRMTEDVDCLSSLSPWGRQAKILGDLCQAGVLVPDEALACRYRIAETGQVVDVLSPDGFNVGGVNPWFTRAIERAARYPIGAGEMVRAVTPPYFLVTKLVAFADRGPDAQSSKDAEDIVALAIEVPSLLEQVEAERMREDVALLWQRVFARYRLTRLDLPDLVAWHLDRRDEAHAPRAAEALIRLSGSG